MHAKVHVATGFHKEIYIIILLDFASTVSFVVSFKRDGVEHIRQINKNFISNIYHISYLHKA